MPDILQSNSPATTGRGGVMGQPLKRLDGALKVTGKARYAADHSCEEMLHAVMAVSTIARGKLTHLDVDAAKRHAGVVEVMTSANRPPLATDPEESHSIHTFKLDVLQHDVIRYANQPIAVVIAKTLEAATEAVHLLSPRYEIEPPRLEFVEGERFVPKLVGPGMPPAFNKGDAKAAFEAADRKIEAVYDTPAQFHNPIEPHVVVASWDGDRLHVDMPSQALGMTRTQMSGLLGIPETDILIESPFIGGAFGAKVMQIGPALLGILAAKLVGKTVKLVLRREHMYGPVTHRGATHQTWRLGADDDGQLQAVDCHALTWSSSFDDFYEPCLQVAETLYSSPNIAGQYESVRLDIGTPFYMRAPGNASGNLALESAIDEMAWECRMDPLAFRLKNYSTEEPMSGVPFSSKELDQCYSRAAERFGWAIRPLDPRSMRDSDGMLVGWGIGSSTMPSHHFFDGNARAILSADGSAVMQCGTRDMGQGCWTTFAQIAADSLALPLEAVSYRAENSDMPDAGMAVAASHTVTNSLAIHNAGLDVVRQLMEIATQDAESPLFGLGNHGVVARSGRLYDRNDARRSDSYQDIMRRAGVATIDTHGTSKPDWGLKKRHAVQSNGAIFAEVKVDPELGQIRVSRLVGAFAAGAIVNPRMAQSQYLGGMIFGMSFALHEQAVMDRRSGRIMNPNIAEYYIPVNADVVSIEAIQVDEYDPYVNALGIKGGVGELGVTGTAGAIANAVWHATGRRIRKFPITLDQML